MPIYFADILEEHGSWGGDVLLYQRQQSKLLQDFLYSHQNNNSKSQRRKDVYLYYLPQISFKMANMIISGLHDMSQSL